MKYIYKAMPAVALIGVLAIPSTAFAGGWIPITIGAIHVAMV